MEPSNQDILKLVQVPDDQRDQAWENRFLAALPHSNLRLIYPQPQPGLDGFPYIYAETTPAAQEPTFKILDWLSTRGIGLLVNPHKEVPDYILTYGMIWNFLETGRFLQATEERPSEFEIPKGTQVMAGPPSEEFLPGYTRKILREFFLEQGILAPKVLVLSQDEQHFDLCLSLDSLNNPPEEEHQGVAEMVSWFLPPHYSLVLIREEGLPPFSSL